MKLSSHMATARMRSLCRLLGISVLAAVPCANASADVMTGHASAFALQADVHAVGNLIGLQVGPLVAVSGNAPAAFDVDDMLLDVNASVLGIASLETGLLGTRAASDVAPPSGDAFAFADSSVNELLLRVIPGFLFVPDFMRVSADTIGSSAHVQWDGSVLTAVGNTIIEDLAINIAGQGMLTIEANPAPNTVLFDSLGIRIVLNEQIAVQNGDSIELTVNALHITVDPLLNIVSSDVIIGQSHASMTVPGPGTAILAAGGLIPIIRRRRAS